MSEVTKELVQELLDVLRGMGYICQLVGGAAYTLYTEDKLTPIKDLDIRFPIVLTPEDDARFTAQGITLTQYLDVNSIGSYRDSVARKSTLNAEFEDRIKYLTKAQYKGIDIDLIVFAEDELQAALSTFDISFNCIAYDGSFIKGSLFDADVGIWLKEVTFQRYHHMCTKFKHKAIRPNTKGILYE
jgi:hypothetical protein